MPSEEPNRKSWFKGRPGSSIATARRKARSASGSPTNRSPTTRSLEARQSPPEPCCRKTGPSYFPVRNTVLTPRAGLRDRGFDTATSCWGRSPRYPRGRARPQARAVAGSRQGPCRPVARASGRRWAQHALPLPICRPPRSVWAPENVGGRHAVPEVPDHSPGV